MPRAQLLIVSLLLLTAAACRRDSPPKEDAVPAANAASPATGSAAPATPEAAPEPPTPRFSIVEHPQHPSARTPDGCVTLELDRQWHSLTYRAGPNAACPRFEQSLDVLHEMLMAFDAYGDLSSMTSLGVGQTYTSFFERLAIASASDPGWNAVHGKPRTGNDNDFVVAVAHDPTKFFPEIVTLLHGTHLRPELRSVEKVFVGAPAATPFADKLRAAGVSASAKVPFDCMLIFHLTPDP